MFLVTESSLKPLREEGWAGEGKARPKHAGPNRTVLTWLTADMAGSTPAPFLAVLRPGLGWAPGDLIVSSMCIWAFCCPLCHGQRGYHRGNPIKVLPSPLANRLARDLCGACKVGTLAQGKRPGLAQEGTQKNRSGHHRQLTHLFPPVLTTTLRERILQEAKRLGQHPTLTGSQSRNRTRACCVPKPTPFPPQPHLLMVFFGIRVAQGVLREKGSCRPNVVGVCRVKIRQALSCRTSQGL